jgi:hypothetical protein
LAELRCIWSRIVCPWSHTTRAIICPGWGFTLYMDRTLMCNTTLKSGSSTALAAALATLQRAGQLKQVGGQYFLPVNDSVIRDTAKNLIEKQGFVTTLQIKQQLRGDGYFVKQFQISEEMTAMVEDGEVEFTNVNTNGKEHRLFYDGGTPEPIAVAAYYTTVH